MAEETAAYVDFVERDSRCLFNHTEHNIHIYDGDKLVLVIKPTAPVYRIAETDEKLEPAFASIPGGDRAGIHEESAKSDSKILIPVVRKQYVVSEEMALPSEKADIGYIVSLVVATANTNRRRRDLYSSNSGSGAVRKNGVLLGTRGLVKYN